MLAHGLFLWALIAAHEAPATAQAEGGAPVGVDLVGTASAASAPSERTLSPPKPKEMMRRVPALTETPAPQPDSVLTDVDYTLPAVMSSDSQSVLSDADTQALSQFQPASAQIGAGQPCNLTSAVVHDFSQSPTVRQGVAELPPGEKSVANAVQIWDGAWPAETQSGGMALLRGLLIREINAAPAACLTQINTGPVFFMVPDGEATVVVAVGSGQWTWGQLLE